MTPTEYIYLFTPLLIGYSISAVCTMDKNAGASVKYRPPGWVFAIVWPVLYILLGLSWVYAQRQNKYNTVVYLIISLLLGLWLIQYSCNKNKKSALIILIITVVLSTLCLFIGDKTSKLLITPLIAWLIFATYLNYNTLHNK